MRDDTEVLIHGSVRQAFETAKPQVKFVFGNEGFDWNNPPPIFLHMEVVFYDGKQIGIAAAPKTRLYGYVYGCCQVKEGSGNREHSQALDALADLLEYRTFVGPVRVRLEAREYVEGVQPPKGWDAKHVKLAFTVDPV